MKKVNESSLFNAEDVTPYLKKALTDEKINSVIISIHRPKSKSDPFNVHMDIITTDKTLKHGNIKNDR